MSPEEARIIRDVFERVRGFGPARDPDARAAVEAELRANPDAAVGLVQAVVGLERERLALEQRLAEYERGQDSAPSGGLFGGGPWGGRRQEEPMQRGGWQQQPEPQRQPWGRPQAAQPSQQYGQPAQPWGQQPPPQQPQRGGGLFGTLLGAAGGLAAGYVGYEAMKGLFGGGQHAGGGLFGNDSGNAADAGNAGGGFLEERDRTAADDAAFFDDGGNFDIGGGGDDDSFA